MKKTIYQLACFLQEENNTHAISMEDFKEDTELAKEEILNLLTDKIGKCAAEDNRRGQVNDYNSISQRVLNIRT
jgi:hypothetical protein